MSRDVAADPFGFGFDMRSVEGRRRLVQAVSARYLETLSGDARKRLLRNVRQNWPAFRQFQTFRRPGSTRRSPGGRRRRHASASRRGPPSSDPDDPEPGGAGLQSLQRLRVIAPDRFRRDADAWPGAA